MATSPDYVCPFGMVFTKIGYCIAVWAIIRDRATSKSLVSQISGRDGIGRRHICHNHSRQAQIKIRLNPRTARGNGNRPYSAVPYTSPLWI